VTHAECLVKLALFVCLKVAMAEGCLAIQVPAIPPRPPKSDLEVFRERYVRWLDIGPSEDTGSQRIGDARIIRISADNRLIWFFLNVNQRPSSPAQSFLFDLEADNFTEFTDFESDYMKQLASKPFAKPAHAKRREVVRVPQMPRGAFAFDNGSLFVCEDRTTQHTWEFGRFELATKAYRPILAIPQCAPLGLEGKMAATKNYISNDIELLDVTNGKRVSFPIYDQDAIGFVLGAQSFIAAYAYKQGVLIHRREPNGKLTTVQFEFPPQKDGWNFGVDGMFVNNDQSLLLFGFDEKARKPEALLIDSATGKEIQRLKIRGRDSDSAVRFDRDRKRMVVVGGEGRSTEVMIFELNDGEFSLVASGTENPQLLPLFEDVKEWNLSPDGSVIAFVSAPDRWSENPGKAGVVNLNDMMRQRR
jgi:hypothetical protein